MAMQGNDPNQPSRDNRAVENRPIDARRTGVGFPWTWVWVVIIIAAFWFVGWGWGSYGGWWWGGRRPGIVGRVNTGAQNNRSTAAATPATYGAPPNGAVSTNPANDHITGTGLQVLQSTDKRPFVGKNFQLANVPVQKQVNDHVFWVGRNQGDRILVVTNGKVNLNGSAMSTTNTGSNASSTNVAQGNLVDVQGTVERAPSQSQAEQKWGLGQNGAQRVHQEGVYVMASTFQPVHP